MHYGIKPETKIC